jgi:hypothetical protein
MDFKQLNEELEQYLEREESPEFKNFIQSQRDSETANLQKKRQSYVNDAIDYNKWAKQNAEQGRDSSYDERRAQEYRDKALGLDKKINSKRRNIDKIYKELGDRGIDVNNMKIETITLANKNSSSLNKLLKEKTADTEKKYYLIIPTPSFYSDKEFMMYAVGTSAGKLWSSSLYRNQNIPSMDVGTDTIKNFMKDLNSSKDGKVYGSEVIFLAIAEDTSELRKQRRDAKQGVLNREAGFKGKNITPDMYRGNDSYYRKYGYTDRSGYEVDVRGLQRRLDAFKRERGSFEKPVQQAIERFDELLTKTKDEFNNIDAESMRKTYSFKNFNNILDKLRSASSYIADAKEKATAENIKWINYYLNATEELLDKQ